MLSSLIKRINKTISGKAVSGDDLDDLVAMNLNSVKLPDSKIETVKAAKTEVTQPIETLKLDAKIETPKPVKPVTPKPEVVINVDKKTIRTDLFISTAKKYLNVKEEGGPNKGRMVEAFQKAVDGKASGEPWCCAFIWYCVFEAEKAYFDRFKEKIEAKIFKTEHVLTMWNLSPKELRLENPIAGSLIIWQHLDAKGNQTARGHVGIVSKVIDKTYIETIEGNTKNDTVVEDDGDGVYLLKRNYKSPTGSKRIVGFLLPWG